jgi:hypothetical protein
MEIKGSNFLGFEFKDGYIGDILQFHVLLWKLLKPNLGLKGNLEIYYIHKGFKT